MEFLDDLLNFVIRVELMGRVTVCVTHMDVMQLMETIVLFFYVLGRHHHGHHQASNGFIIVDLFRI